jgi:hypothetical protein
VARFARGLISTTPVRFMARITSGWPPRSNGSTLAAPRGLRTSNKPGRSMANHVVSKGPKGGGTSAARQVG